MATITKETRQTKRQGIAEEALSRATGNISTMNYGPIIMGFIDKGIPENEIRPRENVFTFHAWRALGRTVRKGEKGIKCVTWVPIRKEDKETGEVIHGKRPWTATVFHVSQTEAL